MKKVLVILLALTMVFTLCSCGKDDTYHFEFDDYSDYNLADYVTLPDYDSYTGYTLEVEEVTEENIDTEIQTRLDQGGAYEASKEGTVNEGDTINIEFHGYLSDGSTQDGMNTDDTQITLGSAGYIDGFESGLYGKKVGETVTLNLQFPDEYGVEELNGQPVKFEVTILSKQVYVSATLNEEFITNDSEGEATDEASYREFIRKYLEQAAEETALYNLKSKLYNQITEEATVSELIQEKVDECYTSTVDLYQKMAAAYGYTLSDYYEQQLGLDEEGFKEYVMEYVESLIKNRMIIFAIVQKEDIKDYQENYDNACKSIIESAGAESESDFETQTGFTVSEYCEMYSIGANVLLEMAVDQIYGRIGA